ncbi:hypothetical protein MSPP1_002956 [Malassezia sp. CBS 17886]|nr:hypothetical protein MSPP1_002956 [Malassezia sp. CBS 17886]
MFAIGGGGTSAPGGVAPVSVPPARVYAYDSGPASAYASAPPHAAPPPACALPAPSEPSLAYRDLLRAAMRPRQERILLLLVMATYLLLGAALASASAFARPSVVLFALPIVAAVYSALVDRRTRLVGRQPPPPPVSTTYGAQLLALARCGETWSFAGVYACLALVVVLVFSLAATHLRGWSNAVAPRIYVPAHCAYYVNETWLLLLGLGAATGFVYALDLQVRRGIACRALPPFDPRIVRERDVTIRQRCTAALPAALARALLVLPVAAAPLAVYVRTRDALWGLVLRLVGVQTVARRLVVPSFWVPFHPAGVLAAAAPALVLFVVLVETMQTLFDVYWTQPFSDLSLRSRDPNVALLGGMNDPHPFFSTFAFAELARIALFDKARRQLLFDDVQRLHGRPVAWTGVYTACMGVLDACFPRAPHRPVRTPTRAPDDAAEKHAAAAPRVDAPLSATPLFPLLRMALWLLGTAAHSLWTHMSRDAKHALVPQAVHLAFFAPSPRLLLRAEIGTARVRVAWTALALEHLAEASITEDRYGFVQNDVPRILARLLDADERLMEVRRRIEAVALQADNQLVREIRVLRGALAEAGSEATISTSYAPFYSELQTAWMDEYATLAAALGTGTRHLAQVFAPYGVRPVPQDVWG